MSDPTGPQAVDFASLKVGDPIPELVAAPITREQLKRYARASGDHNPIHLDEEAAHSVGLPGVIAHGMLNMAVLGRAITDWVPQSRVRAFSTRFAAMVLPGDVITCSGTIAALEETNGEKRARLDLVARNQKDEIVLKGQAEVALP